LEVKVGEKASSPLLEGRRRGLRASLRWGGKEKGGEKKRRSALSQNGARRKKEARQRGENPPASLPRRKKAGPMLRPRSRAGEDTTITEARLRWPEEEPKKNPKEESAR